VIQVALNGNRARSENPAIPFTVAEMTESARGAVSSGAASVHFHVRSADGQESIDPADVATALQAMRRAIPGTPIGISTAEWIERNLNKRHEKVASWIVLPDFASVNFNEMGAVPLAELLISRGVGIEAGVGSVLAAEGLIGSRIANQCLRVLIEPEEQVPGEAVAVVGFIEAFLKRAAVKIPRLLHGYERTAWEFVGLATARGYDTRIGFEDVVTMPDGTAAASNAAIIAEATQLARNVAAHRTASS